MTIIDGYVFPRGYKAPTPEPSPAALTSKLTGEALKHAVGFALVDVLKGEPGRLRDTAKTVLGIVGCPMSIEDMMMLVSEIDTEWRAGGGIDVPDYVPPKPPVAVAVEPEPREPVALEPEPTEPDPKVNP